MQNFLKKTVATFTLIATIYTPAFANFYEPHQNRPLVTIIETILNEALGYEETSEMPQLAPFQNTINFALEIINARMEAHNVTGLTIALVDSEKDFTWAQGFGYANTNLNLPVNADTLFQIGSTSKPFTAIAIMQAVEIGLINLDNPVNTYLTDFIHDSVTVRQLLNNTSGIVTNFLRDFLTIGSIHGTAQFKDIIPFLNSTNLTFEPGTQFEYANNNWQLLGMILASVHGHENLFNGFVYETDSVLQNIGMERSTFMFSPYLTNIAMPHTSSELEQHGMYLVSQLPAGSMLSSANDMAIAMKYMLGGNLDYLMKSHTNNIEDLSFMPSMEWYGLGFMQINDGSLTTIGHGGNIVHYHTEMIMHPETGLGVFLSTNSTTGVNIASTTARDILLTAVNEKLGIENPIEYIIEETELEYQPIEIELSYAELQAIYNNFGGVYNFGAAAGIWTLVFNDGFLGWEGQGITLPLTPLSDGSFAVPMIGAIYTFELLGDRAMAILFQSGFELPAERVEDLLAYQAPAEFERVLGTYNFVPQTDTETSIILAIVLSVDELGMATLTLVHRIVPQQTHIIYENGAIIFTMGSFYINETADGTLYIELYGARFERE